MKKLCTLFLALVASSGLWAEDFIVEGIAYNELGGDSVEVTSTSPKYAGSITIPASVTYSSATYRVTNIGYYAFAWCDALSSVTIGNSVTSIGEGAFYGCDSLSSVTIGNGVTSIGDYAFSSCTSLSSVTIPNSVTSIGMLAFYGCYSLSFIDVDAANTHYASVDGVLFNYAKDTLIQYPIGNTRTTYTIPNSVTSIGKGAFNNCSSLSFITCYATTPPACVYDCFYNVDKSIPLYVPEGSIDAYKAAIEWKKFTNIQAITTGIKNVNANVNASRKVMIDGKVVIIKDGRSYDITGTEMR